jgi:hypothetical protein
MALSDSFDFTIQAGDAITDAAQDAGLVPVGQEPDTDLFTKGLRKTNLIMKQWQGLPNFLVWQINRSTLTLTAKRSFSLKPTGGDLDIQIPEKILTATLKQTD